MFASGKCPSCDKAVQHVKAEHIEIRRATGHVGVHGVSYVCPHCSKVLGVEADPLAMLNDAVAKILRALKAKP
jgi:uncharacterized protein with PIN domain